MLLPGPGSFERAGHEVHQQENARAVRQVPCFVISLAVKDDALAGVPASSEILRSGD